MKFNEIAFKIPNTTKTLIYFLVDKNNEVVYVGQTRNGLRRPLSHRDKEYDGIYIIETKEDTLDLLENYYIIKYKPKYNKELPLEVSYSFARANIYIKEHAGLESFGNNKLRKYINELNIKVYRFRGKNYITKSSLKLITRKVMIDYGY